MKGRFDDTIHFNIESDADSLFLKEEVRRVATKLLGQFQPTPQQEKQTPNKLKESTKFLDIKYQSNPLQTEPSVLPQRRKSVKLANRNHLKQLELLKKQCAQKVKLKASQDGLATFPKMKHKTIHVPLNQIKRKTEPRDELTRTPTYYRLRSTRKKLQASMSEQNFKKSQAKPPPLPPPLFMRLENGFRRTSTKTVSQQNKSTSELQQPVKKEIKLRRTVEKHKIIDKQRFIERMQRNFEEREMRLRGVGAALNEHNKLNNVLQGLEEQSPPLWLDNLDLSCIEAKQIESEEERALYEQLAAEM